MPSALNKNDISHTSRSLSTITFAYMNPDYRKPLILFVASFVLIGLGMASKLFHWLPINVSGVIFGAGMLVQLFSILWLIFTIMRPQKK